MEGLEITIINKSNLINDNEHFRIDSDFFKKEFIVSEKILMKNNWDYLGKLSKQIINFGAYSLCNQIEYLKEGVPFLNVADIKPNIIDYVSAKKIDAKLSKDVLWKSLAKENQVLLTIAGTIGNAAVAYKLPEHSNSNQAIANIETNSINPFYLSIYLNCYYGKQQTKKLTISSVQPNLLLTQVKNLKVAILNISFQVIIEKLYKKSFGHLENSYQSYTQAENLLLEAIGLKDFELSKEPINVKSFKESFLTTGRLDAEYYQKKYDDLLNKIKSQKFKSIREIRTDNFRGLQPVYFENGNLDIINSKHILETTLDYNNFEKTSLEYWDLQERGRVFNGDILTYTTGANIGRTQVYLSNKKALASNHVNIIRLKEENPFYIGFVLNSFVGRLQTEKFSAGSAQAELYPKDLDEFLIPIIEPKKQKKIIELVEESFRLKAESERLLEVAKKAVEMAIEEGENKSIEYLKKSTYA